MCDLGISRGNSGGFKWILGEVCKLFGLEVYFS